MSEAAQEGSGARRAVDAALGALDRAAQLVIVVVLLAMVAIVAAEVFGRYVVGASIGWADEVARLAFVWTIFLAIPLGIRLGSHIGIDIVTKLLPPVGRELLMRAAMLASALVLAIVAYQSVVLAIDQWDERMPSLPVSAQLFIVAVAIGAAHSTLHLLRIAAFGAYPVPRGSLATE